MKRAFWAGLSLSALLLTVCVVLSRAEAAPAERQEGAAACGFCNGLGADPEAPWRMFAARPCRQCGGTGIRQPGHVGRMVIVSDGERPTGSLREFG